MKNNKPTGKLLSVRNLVVEINTMGGVFRAVDGLSFDISPGETIGIVGESGCGKSMTAMAILRLLPESVARIAQGEIRLDDRDLVRISEAEMRRVRGNDIAMIFQDPMSSLNPLIPVGEQIGEPLVIHRGYTWRRARQRALELLDLVQIPERNKRIDDYPYEMSGGMRQRVMIAMALACDPKLLIADEPTTALDVTIQAQILELLRTIQKDLQMAVIFITHDMGVVAEFSSMVLVMYAGKCVEYGPASEIFANSMHPYSIGLLNSIPKLDAPGDHRLVEIPGLVPAPGQLTRGCVFNPRCGLSTNVCRRENPDLTQISRMHFAACFHSDKVGALV